jgi:tryptophanyl-tRNA synthetase
MSNFNLQSITPYLSKLDFISTNLLNLLEYQRGMDEFTKENKSNYYLYTGRGPSSSSFHIGHLPSLNIILEFQNFLQNKIYFMISDDEKMFRDKIDKEIMKNNVVNTISQLNKIGFSDKNTEININSNGISKESYQIIIKLMGMCTLNELEHIFGKKIHIGEYFYVFYQLMPCFISDKQCIVIAGVDQEPFFRLARDLADKLKHPKPIIIYTKNIPGLDSSEKMSTSLPSSLPIFIDDDKEIIKNKIMKITKVGAGTLDELFQNGADIKNCIVYILIDIFENNRKNVDLLKKAYTTGIYINSNDYDNLLKIIDIKYIKLRGKVMLTTLGLRIYLIDLLNNIIQKIGNSK